MSSPKKLKRMSATLERYLTARNVCGKTGRHVDTVKGQSLTVGDVALCSRYMQEAAVEIEIENLRRATVAKINPTTESE